MQQARTSDRNQSLSHALEVLNDAAEDSAQEIRKMVSTDFRKLQSVLSEVKPSVQNALGEMKNVAADSMNQVKERVVATTKDAAQKVDVAVHRNAWTYLGSFALISMLAGFAMGRRRGREGRENSRV
jgi:ElaB/YqjD/DUF883 family membrane-anchored ribosome-binding protein